LRRDKQAPDTRGNNGRQQQRSFLQRRRGLWKGVNGPPRGAALNIHTAQRSRARAERDQSGKSERPGAALAPRHGAVCGGAGRSGRPHIHGSVLRELNVTASVPRLEHRMFSSRLGGERCPFGCPHSLADSIF
jgi:hypothetical protein